MIISEINYDRDQNIWKSIVVGPGPNKGWETLIYMSVRAPGAMRRAENYLSTATIAHIFAL